MASRTEKQVKSRQAGSGLEINRAAGEKLKDSPAAIIICNLSRSGRDQLIDRSFMLLDFHQRIIQNHCHRHGYQPGILQKIGADGSGNDIGDNGIEIDLLKK